MKSSAIGVFDSGIGGLTVVKQILKELPGESVIYLGDTARVPYGGRGSEVINNFAKELTEFMVNKSVKTILVACNTMSAVSLEKIKKISPVGVIDVIEPTVKEALKETKNKKIGVIGTRATINSGIYGKKIKTQDPRVEICEVACPLFVSLAEEGLAEDKIAEEVAKKYLADLKKKGIDVLILGCTHYPILIGAISKVMGPKVKIIDSAKPTAETLKKFLRQEGLENTGQAEYEFYVTDAPERTITVAESFFGAKLPNSIKKVII